VWEPGNWVDPGSRPARNRLDMMQRYTLKQGKLREDARGKWVQFADVEELRTSLEELLDAADRFLAEPPEGMRDGMSFNQYTTAGDCRELTAAYAKARKVQSEQPKP